MRMHWSDAWITYHSDPDSQSKVGLQWQQANQIWLYINGNEIQSEIKQSEIKYDQLNKFFTLSNLLSKKCVFLYLFYEARG